MKKAIKFAIILMVFLSVSSGFAPVWGHSLFNSAEEFIGEHRVQIATLPEMPTTGESSQILLRVTDVDFNEVDRFTMGLRIFFNEQQIDAFPPQSHEGSHWEIDYVFETHGNHIFRVDLYDSSVSTGSGVVTYTFNVSTQNPFGYIFVYSIAIGSIMLAIIIAYIYLPKKLKTSFRS